MGSATDVGNFINKLNKFKLMMIKHVEKEGVKQTYTHKSLGKKFKILKYL